MTKIRTNQIEQALQAHTRLDILNSLRPRRPTLTLPDIKRLTNKLASLNEPRQPLKTAVVHTYTAELLEPYWQFEALLSGFELDMYVSPYGSLLQEVQPGSALITHKPDVTYLFLQWQDLDPRLGWPLATLSASERRELAEAALEYLHKLLSNFHEAITGLIVVTLLPRFFGPPLGNYDAMSPESEAEFRASFKTSLAARLRSSLASVFFDDLDVLTEETGRLQMFDFRLWHASHFPFSVSGAQALVRRLMCYPVLLKKPKAKCIALDADNTLWGGIIGEDGLNGISLGPDYPGSVFVDFQRRLLDFQKRGFLLALCSKNNPQDVREVLSKHPHQVLREKHFAAIRINWLAKPDNLQSIAEELNLGLESFIFVDDSPHECLSIQRCFSQVNVVKVPEEISDIPFCLDDLPHLEILNLTEEDQQRTQLYVQERKRQHFAASSQSLEDYLTSLRMVMTVGLDDSKHIPRIAQLTQKTNQFNLTTRRYTEGDIQRFIRDSDWLVAHFSLADIFGDSGLVGVALIRGLTAKTAEIDSFLVSCRVIGRKAETAFLFQLFHILKQHDVTNVRATYIPTAKNMLVKDFWHQHGFQVIEPNTYEIKVSKWVQDESPPITISVQHSTDAAEALESADKEICSKPKNSIGGKS